MSEVLGSKCWVFENRHCGNICSQQQPVFFTVEVDQCMDWKGRMQCTVTGVGQAGQVVRDVGPRFHKYYTYHLKANGCYKRMGVSDYRKFAVFPVLSRPKSASDEICST